MLAVVNHSSEASPWEATVNNRVPLSDHEVSQRVLHIRSGWSVQERVERRREAERRFAELVDALADATAA